MYYPTHYSVTTPDKIAFQLLGSGETVSFRQLEERSNQAARLFRNCGAATGDHIVILMENNRQFLELCFGADRSGLYYTAVNTHLLAQEVEYIARDCGAKVFITSPKYAELVSQIKPRLNIKYWFMVGDPAEGFEGWDVASKKQDPLPIPDEAQGLDMLYSSGTTGQPKGIQWPLLMQPPGQRTMLIDLLCGLYRYDQNARYLSPAPLYHAAPMRHTMTVIKGGGTAFIMERFDAEKALQAIETHRITHSQWVPTMFVRMLKLPEELTRRYDLSSLKFAIHAAAPCPIDVKEKMIAWWGPIIYEYYAGTENNGFCAITTEEWLSHKGSVGRAILGELHICDENGIELPVGNVGEVYFANGHPFSYHNDPAKTVSSRNAQQWTTLGDIGRVDEDGYLYLVDRKSFLIISGGVNIYPQEIEDVILSHPAVADAAVIGVPNEDFGEEVKAVIQLLDPSEASDDLATNIIEHCKANLSAFKCPRSVDFMAELPRQPTGKLYKRLLREQYVRLAT
ncbi:MAG: AMP-binding protein [Afipia sp.]|nr:AMP-binding protein [Afipia sp.]